MRMDILGVGLLESFKTLILFDRRGVPCVHPLYKLSVNSLGKRCKGSSALGPTVLR